MKFEIQLDGITDTKEQAEDFLRECIVETFAEAGLTDFRINFLGE